MKAVKQETDHVAFGRNSVSNKMHGGIPKVPKGPQKELTTANLQSF